jgi:predicted membrane channel-forming protein YqfA (hemolysin III family)
MFIFIACGIWLIGLGLYFMFLRPALLPEDLRYMGTNPGEIQSAMRGLEGWVRRVFTVMGGFMAAAGVLTILVARSVSALREKWTWLVLALVGLCTVGIMSFTNFQLNSDFKWLLLIPSLLWIMGLMFFGMKR